ncbi:SDR family oxidoreductase [Leucobacter chromiireducens subsp. solipictus]|uniref:SDR family oxidoreductase n=2 Tax=Leucobacter TaxID=55968 RepID=A0ABS1SKF9_9MICO|nr:SDR family oxidoreductase [Leucobacter chromiireducens]MBL3680341.1 SDR family oxidoreductase [Leucobacter chromiireducens subsp. solipictus]
MSVSDSRQTALITGASGGMGAEIARELRRTHRVILVGRNAERLAAVAADTGGEVWQLDVTDEAALARRVAELDRLDVIVHAAAIARSLGVEAASPADWDAHFAVNVTAPATLTRLALPLLRAARGTVVFIGSGAGTQPAAGSAVYTASKHALRGLADVLRIDEEPHLLRVATVAPGQTDTEMLRGLIPADAYRPEHYVQPSSVARAVRFVVDAPADVQLTDVAVRPRRELHRI